MPFWTFFSATFIGKAMIKVSGQAMFFIFVFSESMLNWLLTHINDIGLPAISTAVSEFMENQRSNFVDSDGNQAKGGGKSGKSGGWIKVIWSIVIISFMLMFILSIVESFAKQKQRDLDDMANEEWMTSMRLSSPILKQKPLSGKSSASTVSSSRKRRKSNLN